jgi:hypothetical protein
MKNFDSVRKIKKEIERVLIADEMVVSIGTVKEKGTLGQETENYAIQIGLISKADAITVARIRKKISALLEMADETGAQSVRSEEVKITFVEEGKIFALDAAIAKIKPDITANFAIKFIGKPMAIMPTELGINHMTTVSHAMSKAGFFGMHFPVKKRDFSIMSSHVPQRMSVTNKLLNDALRSIPRLLRR